MKTWQLLIIASAAFLGMNMVLFTALPLAAYAMWMTTILGVLGFANLLLVPRGGYGK